MLRMKGALGVYVGWESLTMEPRVFSRAFFRELAEPWRVGGGLRIRLGTRAVQVGRYRINTEGDMSALKQLGGRELGTFTPSEIGAWGSNDEVRPSEEEPTG